MSKKSKKKLIIPIGLPGAGKSHARPEGYCIVCRDDIRFMLLNYPKSQIHFLDELEPVVRMLARHAFQELIILGKNIYVDETNLRIATRLYHVALALAHGYVVEYWMFDNSHAIKMNQHRNRRVPYDKMQDMINEFEMPSKEEKALISLIKKIHWKTR